MLRKDFVVAAMSVMGLSNAQQSDILRTVAAILHLGNVTFTEKGNYAEIATPDSEFKVCCLLIKCKEHQINVKLFFKQQRQLTSLHLNSCEQGLR